MNTVVVILEDAHLNLTLAGIEYDRWGQKTKQPIIICQSWAEGFQQAVEQGFKTGLFVRSGTVFVDWQRWTELIDNYPHQGLVAHIIWHPDQQPYINDQCWLADLTKFSSDDLSLTSITQPIPVRSTNDLHDNYTPLWIRSSTEKETFSVNNFGQGLIAKQLNNQRIVSNWSNSARDLKFFCYPSVDVGVEIRERFSDYLNLAETQLWVFNNELITPTNCPKLVTPGSGLFWMLSMLQSNTHEVQVVDISQTQINFCLDLWNNWNGKDYGEFVYNFIHRYQLKHFEIDQADMSDIDRLKLKNSARFIAYVNKKFNQILNEHGIMNFSKQWQLAKEQKIFKAQVGNLVHWVLNNPQDYDKIWISNILDYKWTKLNNTYLDYLKFQQLL